MVIWGDSETVFEAGGSVAEGKGVEVGKEPGTWWRSWLGHLLTEGLE